MQGRKAWFENDVLCLALFARFTLDARKEFLLNSDNVSPKQYLKSEDNLLL